MNIQALSRTELNRAMLWLYPLKGNIWMADVTGSQMIECKGWINVINYLTDWNLTMPLAFENELEVSFMKLTRCENRYDGEVSSNKNPLRAICEVLVMIRMEGK